MSVNPYQELPLYGPEAIAKYQGRELYERPPHLYAVANAAYGAMKRRSRDTCIVISGTCPVAGARAASTDPTGGGARGAGQGEWPLFLFEHRVPGRGEWGREDGSQQAHHAVHRRRHQPQPEGRGGQVRAGRTGAGAALGLGPGGKEGSQPGSGQVQRAPLQEGSR